MSDSMDDGPGRDRRAYFRLSYPQNERPLLRSEGRDFRVSEISEGGCRILLAESAEIDFGPTISGEIHFHDGEVVAIEGAILRCNETELIIQLSKGVSQRRMIAEQIWLRKKYLDSHPE